MKTSYETLGKFAGVLRGPFPLSVATSSQLGQPNDLVNVPSATTGIQLQKPPSSRFEIRIHYGVALRRCTSFREIKFVESSPGQRRLRVQGALVSLGPFLDVRLSAEHRERGMGAVNTRIGIIRSNVFTRTRMTSSLEPNLESLKVMRSCP